MPTVVHDPSSSPASTAIRLDHLFKAQFGEDRVLWEVFRHRRDGYFIEVGAYDGVTLSNTFFLEQMGWRGLLVEAMRPMCERAAAARPRSRVIHAAVGGPESSGTTTFTVAENIPVLSFLTADEEHRQRCLREGARLVEIEVPLLTLDDILRHERSGTADGEGPWQSNRGWRIDLVSIDVEGGEMDVLAGFGLERFKPRLLVVENDRPSGAAIEPHLNRRGYRKFHRQKINDFYVRVDGEAPDLRTEGWSVGGQS